jgi:hypothetical protein
MAEKKDWNEMNRKEKTIGLVVIAIIIVVIIGVFSALTGTSKSSTTTPAAAAKSTTKVPPQKAVAAAPTQAPNPQPAKPVLTKYGAKQSDWDKTHTADNRFSADSSYNPTPGLGESDKNDDAYYALNGTSSYEMRLAKNGNVQDAITTVMNEFPSDAKIVWQQLNTTDTTTECYQVEIESGTLGAALTTNGRAYYYLDTEPGTDNLHYNPANVNHATLTYLDYATPSEAPGC